MLFEIMPIGEYCNLDCQYCYEKRHHKYKPIENPAQAIQKAVKSGMTQLLLFGGEPLQAPLDLLETMIVEQKKSNINNITIQTNLVLLNDRHIELFKKYKVSIGVSIDGPAELNRLRKHRHEKLTDLATQKTIENIKRLYSAGLSVGLIITLHKYNQSTREQLDKLIQFILELEQFGVSSARLHSLELQDENDKSYAITPLEYAKQVLYIHDKLREHNSKFSIDIIADIRKLLTGETSNVTCTFNACGFTRTASVSTMDNDGIYPCGRTYKFGKYMRSEQDIKFRLQTLAETEEKYGGCAECKYFPLCKGGCPSQGIDFDFRNRDTYCEAYKYLFTELEKRLLHIGTVPITMNNDYEQFRQQFIEGAKQFKVLTYKDFKAASAHNGTVAHTDGGYVTRHTDHADNTYV